ncbi:MAG: SDR family oxidoreductase [Nitrospirae bacterium]|nr:SDR family oxidoreductase [Nitrospirota bacterium]
MPRSRSDNRPLAGQVALVTGASQGIGLAIAHALAGAGCNVAVGSRTLHRSEALAKELVKAHHVKALPIELDVTKPPSVQNMAEKLLKYFMRIDIIVNNAGVMHMDQLLGADVARFTETLGTNVGGPFLVTRALVEEMMRNRRGHIVNIAAMAGLGGAPFLSAYCASKAALVSLTQSWAAELADFGITVHALCPDIVDTAALRAMLDVDGTPMLAPRVVAERVLELLTGDAPESGTIIPLEVAAT